MSKRLHLSLLPKGEPRKAGSSILADAETEAFNALSQISGPRQKLAGLPAMLLSNSLCLVGQVVIGRSGCGPVPVLVIGPFVVKRAWGPHAFFSPNSWLVRLDYWVVGRCLPILSLG